MYMSLLARLALQNPRFLGLVQKYEERKTYLSWKGKIMLANI